MAMSETDDLLAQLRVAIWCWLITQRAGTHADDLQCTPLGPV